MNKKILIVDDSATNRATIEYMLGDWCEDHDVELLMKEARDGLEAIEACKKTHFDLIFMDMRMPVMDGFEATTEIRKFEKKHKLEPIPIVAMTAGTEDLWKEKCTKAGLNGVLLKPMNLKNIEEMIGRLIHINKD